MVGLGENKNDYSGNDDCRFADVDFLTIGRTTTLQKHHLVSNVTITQMNLKI